MQQLWDSIWRSISQVQIWDFIDMLIIAIIIYQLLMVTRQSRAIQVLKGFAILLLAAWLSEVLRLQTLNWLLNYVINAGAVLMVVVFQPELRRILEQLGRGKFFHAPTALVQNVDQMELQHAGEQLEMALRDMSASRTGALVVIERSTPLGDVIESGTLVDAHLSANLLENIFYPNTPLHDGAIVVRASRVVAAGCLLPLTQRTDIDSSLGTRHRAAIGMSEVSDALSFVVSEETGFISATREGRLQHNIDSKTLHSICADVFGMRDEKPRRTAPWSRRRKRS
nr:diadenylate cyclase CdaA [Maliibacterium massiliense]